MLKIGVTEIQYATSVFINPNILYNEDFMKKSNFFVTLCSLALSVFVGSQALAAVPEKIVVGYQPFDTISYSAIIIQDKQLWKKYLPEGIEIEWQAALQGSIIVNAMLADKQQIGYLGDMPAVISVTKPQLAAIKLVASLGYSDGQRCNIIMVRKDAPEFASPEEAIKWLDGKVVAVPKGSCADRFLRIAMAKGNFKPKEILNQSLEVIATNFRVNKIDAAVLWEPTASRIGELVGEGVARIATTGYNFESHDAGFVAMRDEFIQEYPEIALGWLKAELEAQAFILDPKNWDEVGRIVAKYATGLSPEVSWFSIYGAIPSVAGGAPERDTKPFVFTEGIDVLLEDNLAFLFKAKVVNMDKAPEGSFDDSLAYKAAEELGIKVPMGAIIPLDVSKAPK